MKAVVIYDSVFGNTEKIARAIAEALGGPPETVIVQVGDLKSDQLTGVDLLVIGSPTRGFRPTKAIQDLLKGLSPQDLQGVRVAAFDTRMSLRDVNNAILTFMTGLFGYAADTIASQIKKKKGNLILPPGGFIVKASEGPLKDGELERAGAWARQILAHP
jgi:flavodoxin